VFGKPIMFWRAGILLFVLAWSCGLSSSELAPSRTADEAAVEQRLATVSGSLRCLVCQDESLSGSHAGLAQDLRREIRTMIQQGKSDQEIVGAMLDRYSDFVRHHSSFAAGSYWWLLPIILFFAAAGLLIYLLRPHGKSQPAPPDMTLSNERQQTKDPPVVQHNQGSFPRA
jgi:cytochrome c-type biogenesis protein CcmH